jgi:phospholipase/carboxylesterase
MQDLLSPRSGRTPSSPSSAGTGGEPGRGGGGARQGATLRAADGRLASRPRSGRCPAGAQVPAGVTALDLHLGGPAEALLAVPERVDGARPLLVCCHGAGGAAADGLRTVADAAIRRGVLVLATTSVSATWDLLAGGLGPDVAVLDAALGRVFATHDVGRVALGGFSDGASYALSLGLANGDLFEAVLAFSPGFAAPPRREGRPRVWISHGTGDRVLPVARCGRRVSRDLAATGYDVTYVEFDGGHVVPPDLVTAALDGWLGDAPDPA